MTVTQRAANLQAFREDPNVSVILMSLKSGGEGINLQAANYVYVIEPWWNPAVEMQEQFNNIVQVIMLICSGG